MGDVQIKSRSSETFRDRPEAGRLLGEALADLADRNPVVLGVPRGGVVVARHVAEALGAEMDVILARKIGAPGHGEMAIGAVTEEGKLFLDPALARRVGADEAYVEREKEDVLAEIHRRASMCRDVRPKVPLEGRTVICTDDGVATGMTMKGALWAARQEAPKALICALPVAPGETLEDLADQADRVLCLRVPPVFGAVGRFYARFDQTTDDEVRAVLRAESTRSRPS